MSSCSEARCGPGVEPFTVVSCGGREVGALVPESHPGETVGYLECHVCYGGEYRLSNLGSWMWQAEKAASSACMGECSTAVNTRMRPTTLSIQTARECCFAQRRSVPEKKRGDHLEQQPSSSETMSRLQNPSFREPTHPYTTKTCVHVPWTKPDHLEGLAAINRVS